MMMDSSDAQRAFEEIRKAIPSSNVLALRQLEALKDHVAELEYLIADLADGLENDGLNERVNSVLKTDQDVYDDDEDEEDDEDTDEEPEEENEEE